MRYDVSYDTTGAIISIRVYQADGTSFDIRPENAIVYPGRGPGERDRASGGGRVGIIAENNGGVTIRVIPS